MKTYTFRAGVKTVNGVIVIERYGKGYCIKTFFNNEAAPLEEKMTDENDLVTNVFQAEQNLIRIMADHITERADQTGIILHNELAKQGFFTDTQNNG